VHLSYIKNETLVGMFFISNLSMRGRLQ